MTVGTSASRTDAEIIGWLNSDDVLLPGALQAIGGHFARRANVDVVYATRLVIDEAELEVGRWVVPSTTHEFLDLADYITQEALRWRRSLWERVAGQLDVSRQFAIDWDRLLRFIDASATFARSSRVLGACHVHEQSKTAGANRIAGDRTWPRSDACAAGATSPTARSTSSPSSLHLQARRERFRDL
jgi:hypothetical protein